ncbi:MAG: DUF4071 domain-containing protein, partial [Armatimonadetes bacterium]|nr:DUF4071 domain-containing protein [Armatimonadota bacterium]
MEADAGGGAEPVAPPVGDTGSVSPGGGDPGGGCGRGVPRLCECVRAGGTDRGGTGAGPRGCSGVRDCLSGVPVVLPDPLPLVSSEAPVTRDDTDSGIPDPALLPTAELLDLEGCLRLRRSLYAQQADPREAVREFARLGRRLLDLGENLLAQDVVAEGLRHQPSDRELRQLAGLALARSGSPDRAHRILEELHREGHTDEETLGILARCCRDLGLRSPDPVARRRWMAEAGALYRRAFETTGGIYSGINAATLLLLLGDGQAESMARAVRDRCLTLLAEQQDSTADLYWALATLGEAHLVLQDWEQARRWYAGAARYGRGRSGSLAATRRNALLLIQHYQQDQVDLGRFLPLPRVAVFTGHMVDRPDRPTPRFPSELEPVVARALRQRLLELEVGEGYASAACGSDLLFLETLQDLGAQTHVVLPYEREAFLRESVLTSGDDTWRLRFDLALSRAGSHVTTVAPSAVPADGLAYEYANRVLHGLASLRATELSTDLVGIAVWDGQRGDLLGGTEATIRWWKKRGLRVEVVRLDRLAGRAADRPAQPRTGAPTVSPRAASLQAPTPHAMRVRAILFADVVGYSKLTDLQVQP